MTVPLPHTFNSPRLRLQAPQREGDLELYDRDTNPPLCIARPSSNAACPLVVLVFGSYSRHKTIAEPVPPWDRT